MKIFRTTYSLALFFIIIASSTYGQQDLQPYRNRSAKQIADVAHLQKLDTLFFFNRIGDPIRDLTSAIGKRGITTYDVTAGTLTAAKDTAVARGLPFIVTPNWNGTTLSGALFFSAADSDLVMFVYGTITFGSPDTIPAGAQIYMGNGGRFKLNTGTTTLLINGEFHGSRARVFFGDNQGNVKFGSGSIDAIFPEWWGAKNDSTGSWGTAFQYAVDSSPYRHGTISLNGQGKGYIVNSKVTFPNGSSGREIYIEGNGATIYSSASDTVFMINNISSLTLGPKYPRHAVVNTWFKRILGSEDAGVAICIKNSVEQRVNFCNFQDWKIGVLLLNSTQGGVVGWTEGCTIANNRFTACDTAVSFKKMSNGHESFATTRLEHNSIALGGAASRLHNQQAVGIYIGTSARAYRCSFDQVYIGLTDSCTGIYIDGELDGSWGHIGFETFGATEDESRYFEIGPNANNLMADFYVGYEGLNHTEYFVKRPATNKQFNFIKTQIVGDGNGDNRGFTRVVSDTAFTRLESIMPVTNLNTYQTADSISGQSFYFTSDVDADGDISYRYKRAHPPEFLSIDDGLLTGVRLLDIGNNRTTQNDSTTLSVRNSTHILIGNDDATIDSLTAFKGGTAGQTITVNFVDDSVFVCNLIGGTGSGRLFLIDNRHSIFPSGTKSVFKCESETAGVAGNLFWREISREYPNHNVQDFNIGDTTGVVLTTGGAATIGINHNVILDTFGAAAADTVVTLTGKIGDILYISTRNSSRDITFLDAGNFQLAAERVLSDIQDVLCLKAITSTTWKEISFSDNN